MGKATAIFGFPYLPIAPNPYSMGPRQSADGTPETPSTRSLRPIFCYERAKNCPSHIIALGSRTAV
jgi:hypothetical protein